MKKLTLWDIIYASNMAVACALSYVLATALLGQFADQANTLLGGMWAAVATIFVFRETREKSFSAGCSRLIATCVSLALCFIYVALFRVNALGIGLTIGAGTLVVMMLGWRDDIVTTGITSAVVLVVAALDPQHALAEPPLRLLDTVVGVAVGVLLKWCASYAVARAGLVSASGEPVGSATGK
ncbi:FUSC family protein [Bradyrhizobium tropiciagri]|uniref:FUSC family protein n=1 Tax=Bradyrhizobium tropiciagri TaxID=312253 RepID=UPI000A5FB607|nr:FUSC family protein [Bradyrhizobium tropiciagri]